MDDRPFHCCLSLKDGRPVMLFQFRDFLDIVSDRMGEEARRELESFVNDLEKAANYTETAIDTDLTSYESSLESNTVAFQDIQHQISLMWAVLNKPRVNRNELIKTMNEIDKIIRNQL